MAINPLGGVQKYCSFGLHLISLGTKRNRPFQQVTSHMRYFFFFLVLVDRLWFSVAERRKVPLSAWGGPVKGPIAW